jgi:IclR family acetate operon transcriptional repressor
VSVVPVHEKLSSSKTATDKVLTVLSAFATRPDWDLSSLASTLGLPKSTTHRLLNDLKRQGYVRQLPDSYRYALGYQLARIANAVTPHSILKAAARSALEELAATTGETAFLVISDNQSAVCLDLVEPRSPIRYSISVGTASPLHRGSSGRVLLAFGVSAARDAALSQLEPGERTTMEEDLEVVRARGWAYTVGELTPGTGAIAVPIFAPDGSLAGCLALGGPEDRLTLAVGETLYPRVRASSDAITAAL